MPAKEGFTTTVSTKGEVVLPKAVRRAMGWEAGKKLIVHQTHESVVLKPFPVFAPTKTSEVFGCLKYSGAPKTVEEMDASILTEAKRRHEDG
ncbi:MAG: AbrB family transcriptional regulator [Gammaproteobacteria bacterium]|nr:AbrB family transcriptional regulator [Gammaproteobacteria bacterium]MXW44724.1 AbrB/MazE/SpoVT family DNA-binding domain-containing protein [Gammaproteobacteria bacterium]MYD01072.1 AbrB/MazE/SpoVT family DNA-binding domain-containing protein [Gammaproteobacteria bacterium]MYI23920.1 AbrB/MazE/SpoVT family DNA-binding domain-containing protein [Gammaproteobacteria bacterium]